MKTKATAGPAPRTRRAGSRSPTPAAPEVVAVLNSNDDLVRLIRESLHHQGYLTLAHHIADFRDGHSDITQFFDERDPAVIIYDLAPPFTLNWQFLGMLQRHPSVKGRQVILTTNNAAALDEIIGVKALQIVGQDKDLASLLAAVNRAFKTPRPLRPRR